LRSLRLNTGLGQVLAPAPRLELGGEGVLVFLRDTSADRLAAYTGDGPGQMRK